MSKTSQQARLSSTAIARFSAGQKSNILVGIASSLLVPTASVALCEDKDKGFLDGIVKKDKDGNIDFTAFWDEIAKASGDKVSCCYFISAQVNPIISFWFPVFKDPKCL